MNRKLKFYFVALLTVAALVAVCEQGYAEQPTRFTFTPQFKDPDPGKRFWEKKGTTYVETLPSGHINTFRIRKQATVNGLKGTMVQKVGEPNLFIFIADSEAKRKELWFWRDKAPWKFLGVMKDISAPQRID